MKLTRLRAKLGLLPVAVAFVTVTHPMVSVAGERHMMGAEAYAGAPPGESEQVACVGAQEAAAQLSLSEAVDVALCNNAQIRGAWAIIRVQAAGVGQARSAY